MGVDGCGCGWDGSGKDWSVGFRDFEGRGTTACCLLFVAAERLCYVDSPVVPPLHCWGVDVAWSAIEVPPDELFKMFVNFLLLISFLDERFVQFCRRFNEAFRFGADLTVPV